MRQYLVALGGGNDKGIIISRLNAIVNLYVPIFEWCADGFDFVFDALLYGREDNPTVGAGEVADRMLLLYKNAQIVTSIKSRINFATVPLSTLHICAIFRRDTRSPNNATTKCFLWYNGCFSGAVFFPFGRPSVTPSAFFLASASLVRWLIRLRSISADKPKANASTLLCMSSPRR